MASSFDAAATATASKELVPAADSLMASAGFVDENGNPLMSVPAPQEPTAQQIPLPIDNVTPIDPNQAVPMNMEVPPASVYDEAPVPLENPEQMPIMGEMPMQGEV